MPNIETDMHQSIAVCAHTPQNKSSFFIEPKTDCEENNNQPDTQKNDSVKKIDTTAAKKKRCQSCKKILKLSSEFTCKCNGLFCNNHRFPDTHNCTYDHRAAWNNKLKERNPQVIADKVPRI